MATRSLDPTRLAAIEALGGKCERCGFDNPIAITLRDGHWRENTKRNPRTEGVWKAHWHRVLAEIQKGATHYHIFCYNCNRIMEFNQAQSEHVMAKSAHLYRVDH